MSFKRLLCATALSTAAISPAAANPVTLWDLLSIDRMANIAAQWSVAVLRSFADVTYTHMDVRPLEGRWIITGLHIAERDRFGPACEISIDRAVIQTPPLDQIEEAGFQLDLIGIEAARSCLDPDVTDMLDALNMPSLVLDRAGADLSYWVASGSAQAEYYADAPGIAEIRGLVDLSYLAFDADREEPIAEFAFGELELVDDGLWTAISSMMPPQLMNQDALAAMMRAELLPDATPPSPANDDKGEEAALAPTTDLTEAEATIDQIAAALSAYANDPGRLVVNFEPDAPIPLSEDLFDQFEDFPVFAQTMQPQFVYGDPSLSTQLTAEDIAVISAWLDGAEVAFSEPDQLRYAEVFLTGIGAPRDEALALDLLTPLLEAGSDEAIALALDTLDLLDPRTAYRIALNAAAAGDRGAFAQLDRLERDLPDRAVLRAQAAVAMSAELDGTETARALRDLAFGHLVGLDSTRNYARAYSLATLALALGDTAARNILDEVDRMADRAADSEFEAWEEALDTATADANLAWAQYFR